MGIMKILSYLVGSYIGEQRRVVNTAQRKLDSYSSKYDNLSDEGKEKYDTLRKQVDRADRKCSANERQYNKTFRK